MLRAFCGPSSNVAAVASEEEEEARLCSAVVDSESAEVRGRGRERTAGWLRKRSMKHGRGDM
jgi:hypothetical protein